jgi:hypothetical protein
VAGAEGPEEARNHDQRPYCARYEVGLLLLVIRLGLWFGELARSAGTLLCWDMERTGGVTSSFLVGLPESLNSDMLCEGLLARGLLALRALLCWNLTSLRGRAIVYGGAGCGES